MMLLPQVVQITTVSCGEDVKINLPKVFEELTKILPLVTMLFGKKKNPGVSSRELHAALGVARNHSTWLVGVHKKFSLVDGEDYVAATLDPQDPANWEAIKANAGKVPTTTFFAPRVAARIATLTPNERGEQVFNYMYAVTDAATDAILREYQMRVQHAKQQFLEADKIATQAALAAGYKSGTHCLIDAQATEKAKRLSASFNEAQGAALMMWEQCTIARRHAKQGRTAHALEALEMVEQAYGTHSDMLRNSPPWASSL